MDSTLSAPGTSDELEASKGDRRAGLTVVAVLVAAMWLVEVINRLDHNHLERFGILPRQEHGLIGVAASPFLHVSYAHLLGNTVPFVVLAVLIALSGLKRIVSVTFLVVLLGGLGTWLIAPAHTDVIGASGVVFGYAGYLIARGIFSRRLLHIGAGIAVIAAFGGVLLFSLEPQRGISWQGHLCGGLAGIISARLLDRRKRRTLPAAA